MRSVDNLLELLKSQILLYSEIRDILVAEKNALVAWELESTKHLGKKKESLTYKEKILEEARQTLSNRVAEDYGITECTLSSIINACPKEEDKKKFVDIKEELTNIVISINNESIALKMLYSTNIRLINDLYNQIGYMPTHNYNKENVIPLSSVRSVSFIG